MILAEVLFVISGVGLLVIIALALDTRYRLHRQVRALRRELDDWSENQDESDR